MICCYTHYTCYTAQSLMNCTVMHLKGWASNGQLCPLGGLDNHLPDNLNSPKTISHSARSGSGDD